jgi:hypothetical protein
MNLHPWADHVKNTWCHDEIRPNLSQLPHQRPHAARYRLLGVANGDDNGASGFQRLDDGSLVTENRILMTVDIDRIPFPVPHPEHTLQPDIPPHPYLGLVIRGFETESGAEPRKNQYC